jgi:protein-disulfide isomerase
MAPGEAAPTLAGMKVPRSRLALLAAAAGAAVVAVVVIAVVVGTGSSDSGSPTVQAAPLMTNLPKGLPQHGLRLGAADAPATVYVFEDPQCPYCRDWSLDVLPAVARQFVATGKVALVMQPIALFSDSSPGVLAVYAAAEQNRGWNMLEELYGVQGAEHSGWLTKDLIKSCAKAAAADVDRLVGAMSSSSVLSTAGVAAKRANTWQIPGTPSFVLEKNGEAPHQIAASVDEATFVATLRSALQ